MKYDCIKITKNIKDYSRLWKALFKRESVHLCGSLSNLSHLGQNRWHHIPIQKLSLAVKYMEPTRPRDKGKVSTLIVIINANTYNISESEVARKSKFSKLFFGSPHVHPADVEECFVEDSTPLLSDNFSSLT